MGVAVLTEMLTYLFTVCWDRCTIPQELRDATILVQKGQDTFCQNKVASIVGSVLSESQCGFRAGIDTLDIYFDIRQMQGKESRLLYCIHPSH